MKNTTVWIIKTFFLKFPIYQYFDFFNLPIVLIPIWMLLLMLLLLMLVLVPILIPVLLLLLGSTRLVTWHMVSTLHMRVWSEMRLK